MRSKQSASLGDAIRPLGHPYIVTDVKRARVNPSKRTFGG
jgi:hypothetical protein